LREAIEAQLAYAIELARLHSRPDRQIGQQRQPTIGEALQHRQAEQRRVGPDLGVEAGAHPAKRLVEIERTQIAAALIQEITGDRGEPGPVRRVISRARGEQQQRADHRDIAMFGSPHA